MIKIKSIEIENYRSIVGEPLSLTFGDFTTITGPNNSGKSNILRAMQLFFTGKVDGQEYTSEFDYPKNAAVANKAQTKITVLISYEPSKDIFLERALTDLENQSDQQRLDNNLISMRLTYSKNGVESWQFLGKQGARNIKRDLIANMKDAIRRSIAFKYIPVGRDSLESITQEIGFELIGTIFSGWAGAVRQRTAINDSITDMIGTLSPSLTQSSDVVTTAMSRFFSEVRNLNLKLPFANLEEMLPSLTPVIKDTAETGLRSKGAGIQTSSLLFLLKYLADNYPKHQYKRKTFIWAIEEPESFLHPTKQRAMAEVLLEFSKEVQTVITTHCAHFVPRNNKIANCHVVEKSTAKPWSTVVVGSDYELARQALGVTLLDSMSLHPINIVTEGPTDEIYLDGMLRKLQDEISIDPYDIKYFPAGNATAATYLFEWLRKNSDASTHVKLLIDGDDPGRKAMIGLTERGKRDGVIYKPNFDYFQLPVDVENLLSDRVKKILAEERPSQVSCVKDINGKITSFKAQDGCKKKVARRAIEISNKSDLKNFKSLFEKVVHVVGS